MKIGTDGVLLGAWADGGGSIVDIGSGSGLVAMMMAQRFPQARIWGIEVDGKASRQASDNVSLSPFAEQITIVCECVSSWYARMLALGARYDALVCNPPFYPDSQPCGSQERDLARHADTLSLPLLMTIARTLLTDDGHLSLVFPFSVLHLAEESIAREGLFVHRCTRVATKTDKAPKRILMSVGRFPSSHPSSSQEELMTAAGCRSTWYTQLTKDFYL